MTGCRYAEQIVVQRHGESVASGLACLCRQQRLPRFPGAGGLRLPRFPGAGRLFGIVRDKNCGHALALTAAPCAAHDLVAVVHHGATEAVPRFRIGTLQDG